MEKIKCLIIGSGPAGYTAAIYAARANINPVIITGMQMGGQLTTTTEVDNFPGYPKGITGPDMMEDLKNQAERFGTEIRIATVSKVNFANYPFKIVIDESKEIIAESVIIATGATAKYIGLESEQKFFGAGVSACATCDGFFYRNKNVAVVGGGDTACEEAVYLSGICSKVYLIVRKNYLRASKAMQDKVFGKKNIEVLFNHKTKELKGEKLLSSVVLENEQGQEKLIEVEGFFVAIGHIPNTEIFKDYIDLDETGYIKTIPGTSKTNIKGVFAAGDVQDKKYRQAITAAGSGCIAAKDAEEFLSE